MSVISSKQQFVADGEEYLVDVTIVMPCLNEIVSLPYCIANAKDALVQIGQVYGLTGEIVIADNGSTDGSQQLATDLGARVVPVEIRGYGAALIGGCEGAAGRFILMGDADGSYDFTDGVAMIGRLLDGADICMGSRFKGGIEPGAMPWKNRYIGNPVLTGILNLFFHSGISDAHCGLRAITKQAFCALRLTGSGMEFASEMVIKAALKKMQLEEVPATLSRDLRDRAPHLRPWRDGWRHLRYLLMLSPRWIFGIPGTIATLLGAAILSMAVYGAIIPGSFPAIGNYWSIFGAAALSAGELAIILSYACQLYGVRQGYRLMSRRGEIFLSRLSLEKMLFAGSALMGIGLAGLIAVLWQWDGRNYGPAESVLPAVLGTMSISLGLQTVMGGFLFAILGGNTARFHNSTDQIR